MRLATVCAAAAAVALAGLMSRCLAAAPPRNKVTVALEPTAAEILYSVSADDRQWYHVLKQKVRLGKLMLEEPGVVAILAELNMDSENLVVQPIVRYLVTHPGSTGSQYQFGVAMLRAGLACHLLRTVMLHMFFMGVYSVRDTPSVTDLRQTMSKIQVTTAGYVDILSFFGYHVIVAFLEYTVRRMRMVFVKCDADNNNVDNVIFHQAALDVCRSALSLLGGECSKTSEKEIAPTVRVANFNDQVFSEDSTVVGDQQLVEMIESMDKYEFIEFGAVDRGYWAGILGARPYVSAEKAEVKNE